MTEGAGLRVCAVLLAVFAAGFATAKGPVTADALTRTLLREAEFENIVISPNGKMLAIARSAEGKATVTLYQRESMAPIITFDPGNAGLVTSLDWMDDERLIIGATSLDTRIGLAAFEPQLMIAHVNGDDPFLLPGNFYGTLDDDPDHLLVYTCGFATTSGGCKVPEIRKSSLKRLRTRGELVSNGPEDSALYPDRQGNARFAIKWDEDAGFSQTFAFDLAKSEWLLLNDSKLTGLDIYPVGVARDGKSGFLQTELASGPDVMERYDFSTGKRTELLRDAASDPLRKVRAVNDRTVIGAVYGPTQPKLRFWDPAEADSKMNMDLQAAFPGHLAMVISAAKDGNLAVVSVWSDRDPGAYYLFDRKARKAALIAREKPWIDPKTQAGQRGIELKARDGVALHGLLTLPPASSGKNLPMVVLPHGGPYGVLEAWGYDSEAQILAQHGYAVLQVNFRGSGGYGREFVNLGARQWGRKMQDDITDATRWAITQGIADGNRICIYGASYGGYAALMGPIREPGLYRCAAGLSGVFDLAKMYKWGSIRNTEYGQNYLKRVIGEDPVELAANSPAMLADKIGVPVLLAHGVRDPRVDIKHAQLMARQLAKLRQPVELLEYSATGHSLMLERHKLDFYARLLAFLDQHTRTGAPGSP